MGWPIEVLKILPNLKKLDGISAVEWKVKISEGNEKQLKQLFEKIDIDGSGDISLAELKEAFSDDDIRRDTGVARESAESIFAKMGDDGNDGISWLEFKEY